MVGTTSHYVIPNFSTMPSAPHRPGGLTTDGPHLPVVTLLLTIPVMTVTVLFWWCVRAGRLTHSGLILDTHQATRQTRTCRLHDIGGNARRGTRTLATAFRLLASTHLEHNTPAPPPCLAEEGRTTMADTMQTPPFTTGPLPTCLPASPW